MSLENCSPNCPAFKIRKLDPRLRHGINARFEIYCIAAQNETITIVPGKPIDEKHDTPRYRT